MRICATVHKVFEGGTHVRHSHEKGEIPFIVIATYEDFRRLRWDEVTDRLENIENGISDLNNSMRYAMTQS